MAIFSPAQPLGASGRTFTQTLLSVACLPAALSGERRVLSCRTPLDQTLNKF